VSDAAERPELKAELEEMNGWLKARGAARR